MEGKRSVFPDLGDTGEPATFYLSKSMSSNANAEEAVMPRSVPVTLAHEFLTAGHRYLDVRTVKEFSGGHAVGAVDIPYMLESVSGNA
ncbi:hypothetical protein GW17_00051483 [Ensete ventricosum]|nr:hypothetical protein GW17_00051483 [Ensete ventricosum]